MSTNQPLRYDGGPVSTLNDRIDEKLRKKIDAAIIKREPRTLVAIYDKFKLAEAGVSYDVLWRYARRIRDETSKSVLLEATLADEIDMPTAISRMLSRQCLEAVLQGEAAPLDLHRLTLAYHKSLQVIKTLREIEHAGARLKDPDCNWTRKRDGTPLTDEEMLTNLAKLAKQIYGANLPGMAPLVRESLPAPTSPGIPSHDPASQDPNPKSKIENPKLPEVPQ